MVNFINSLTSIFSQAFQAPHPRWYLCLSGQGATTAVWIPCYVTCPVWTVAIDIQSWTHGDVPGPVLVSLWRA